MAAGEDEFELVVRELVVAGGRGGFAAMQRVGDVILGGVEPLAATNRVDGLETRGRDQPGARIRRDAVHGPALQGGAEGVVHRILGHVEVAEQADERRENAAGFRAENGVKVGANLDRRWRGHGPERGS